MEKAPKLREVQQWLTWKLTHSPKPEPKPVCFKAIAHVKPLSRNARIGIYSNSFILRLVEVLMSDFEITTRAVGKKSMHQLVQFYIWKYPSKYRSVSEVGCRFSEFLKQRPIAKQLPFLPDVAKLEYLLVESFFSNDSQPLTQPEIAALAGNMQESELHLAPSVRLMASHWNIQQIWERRNASDKRFFTQPAKERTHLMIWRDQGYPKPVVVEGPAYKMLHLIRRGMKFGDILDAMKDTPDLESRLQGWFQDWMAKGILVSPARRSRFSSH